MHAIGLTLIRLGVTKRRLLEWETAAAAAAKATGLVGRKGLTQFVTDMMASPVIAGVVAVVVATWFRHGLLPAAPFLLLWAVAPAVAYWLSLPVGPRERALNDRERSVLRTTARKTWRFFETFVAQDEGWLPPDNFQEDDEEPTLARRTSPTNIGMSLLSTLAAHDLGYISADEMVKRLDDTLTTLEGLERYNGHFLNWYDTATHAPLHPRYVSTVDSGNLAAALLALGQGVVAVGANPQTQGRRID